MHAGVNNEKHIMISNHDAMAIIYVGGSEAANHREAEVVF
jgi:hypothetical protein